MKSSVIEFDSEDTEGSDISYESSFDERLEEEQQQFNSNRGVIQFKDQMQRFIMMNPDLQNNIVLEVGDFENNQEEQVDSKKKVMQSPGRRILQSFKSQRSSTQSKQQTQSKLQLGKWEAISQSVIDNSKRTGQMPSVEEFQQRINLFRRKMQSEKCDIVDLIVSEQDKLLKDIAQQAQRNKERDNVLHQSIEAKVRKETGNVGYISYRKRIQFQFRIKKAEEKAQEKVEKQQKQRDQEMKKSRNIFEKLFQDKKKYQTDDGEVVIETDFKSQAAEELYRRIKKCQEDTEIKQTIIQFIIQHRKKLIEEYNSRPSLFQQGTKFYSEESKVLNTLLFIFLSKEFSLFTPNNSFKKTIQGQIPPDFFDKRDKLEEGNIFLLTKIDRLLEGNLMKFWKNLQETKL